MCDFFKEKKAKTLKKFIPLKKKDHLKSEVCCTMRGRAYAINRQQKSFWARCL